jgi:hypothetical protein
VHNRPVHPRRDVALVVVLCAALGVYELGTRPPTPITSPDTVAYVTASPLVPLGYPVLLKVVGINGAAIVQPVLFAAAMATLGIELLALSASVVVTLALLVAIVLIPDVMAYHRSILTESLFISGLVAFMAATMRFARQPTWQSLVAASLIAGASAAIRRTAYAFAPVIVVMVLFAMRTRRLPPLQALAAGVVPLVACYAIDGVATQIWHGAEATSLTGRHLFAKAALIEAPPAPVSDPVGALLGGELERTFAPVRSLLRDAPADIRASLILFYETCLQWPCVSHLRASLGTSEGETNAAFAAAARARIAAAPWAFAQLTVTHYASLWTAYKLRHPDTSARLKEFLAAHRPLPFERETFKVEPTETIAFAPSTAVVWIQPLVIAVGVFTAVTAIGGLIWMIRGTAPPEVSAATLVSLTAHISLVVTALGAAGLSRFMVAIFPAVVVATGLAGWWVVQKVWRG